MHSLETLEAIVAARKHLRANRELTSFEANRNVGFKHNDQFYRIRGYLQDQQLFFNLHPFVDGHEKDAIAEAIPLISQIACVSDHYKDHVVRCQNLSGNHEWCLEFTKALEVIVSEYEMLPGSQPDTEDGTVYLSNDNGEILSVSGKYLTVFQPVADVEHRMALENALARFQLYLTNTKSGEVTNGLIQSAFLVERALNSGHIDMIAIDLPLVLKSAYKELDSIAQYDAADQLTIILQQLPHVGIDDTPDFMQQ